ncbi:F-box/WD repeat-containing protein 5 [Zootermopsis nevadensis]|uniref:F-box/WD repeat-containing protein 5 n=1 Tax=Zootermopsis nevadensis TaxID=136037 RepID=A0A067QY09_ZOONE|nr:F-box/WD repeat-containing protein 5 [Zootermopsis nevadensis]
MDSEEESSDGSHFSDDTVHETNSNWYYLPDSILLHIFQYLSARELLDVGLTCRSWLRVSYDEFLWKDLFYYNFKIDPSIKIAPGKTSWLAEYKRLSYHTPVVQTEVLKEHSHQVLHVSFAHNGKMFATCSKDGYVLVWDSSYPASIKYYHDMKTFSWKYTQFSQFNQSDTLLLVSGVHFGTPHSTSGEIAVFSLQAGFNLQCRVMNKPYDIFGTWYSDHHLLSGDLHWLAHLVSTSILWLNKASQESESELVPIMDQLYKFYNCNASSIRAVMIANCLAPSPPELDAIPSGAEAQSGKGLGSCERGNPPSHREINNPSTSGYVLPTSSREPAAAEDEVTPEVFYAVSSRLQCSTLESAFLNWRRLGDGTDYACPIQYNAEYRQVETQGKGESPPDSVSENSDSEDNHSLVPDTSMETEECASESDDLSEHAEKYLIFTTGSKTYTPHQIGFKRIKSVSFPCKLDPGPSLREPNWLVYEEVANKFDKVDHLIDLHGHIVGMGLSPDHRYLYVNSRPWPRGYMIKNPLDPPPIAQEIDIHVIDLVTLKEVGTMLRAHKAYTPTNECFFIFLDVCNEYVASGAEDKHGYLWDRHYGVCLAKFPHIDVVNSVAFNPHDPEMLVTTSDDYTVKVWRSKGKVKELRLEESN